ncbi:MAG: reverse transcriptase domain-containing protein [Phycisphaerales bacterium]
MAPVVVNGRRIYRPHPPLCSPAQFRELVRGAGLIRPKSGAPRRTAGVPQGSPISSVLSNVYMLDVDRHMSRLASEHSGLYLRYSDDILLCCRPEKTSLLSHELESSMKNAKLTLHDGLGKRSVSVFSKNSQGSLSADRPLQYLGFSFDGRVVRIRSQTVAKFLRRMKRAARREQYIAAKYTPDGEDVRVRRKRLYEQYSHIGSRKNFVNGYARAASKEFACNAIREQIKPHWKELHAAIEIIP